MIFAARGKRRHVWTSTASTILGVLVNDHLTATDRVSHIHVRRTGVVRQSVVRFADLVLLMASQKRRCTIFSARCNIYISRLCYDVSVCLSVTEVNWRIIANLGFKFRSKFIAHCRRGDGSSQQHLALY